MKARILALLVVVALLVTATVLMTSAETPPDYTADLVLDADNMAECPVCGESKEWTVLTAETTIPTIAAGSHPHYYVEASVTNNTVNSSDYSFFMYVTDGSVCLHLGGAEDVLSIGSNIHLSGAGVVNVMGSGTLLGTGATETFSRRATAINNHSTYGVINIYSGTIESALTTHAAVSHGYSANSPATGKTLGQINIYDDAIIQGAANSNAIDMPGGRIVMHGGTVNGRVFVQSSSYKNAAGNTVWMKPKFTIHDGTINGVGTEETPFDGNGGAVYLSYAEFTMNGGIINGGYVTGSGGAIATLTATNQKQLYIYGGTINGGYAGSTDYGGGAIYVDGLSATSLSTLTISGNVTITGGKTAGYGGNILVNNTTTTIGSGVTIADGEAATGGNVRASKKTVFDLQAGAVIKDGHSSKSGGNISVSEAVANIYGTIQDGQAGTSGGNAVIAGGTGYVYVDGGTIKDGTAATSGGNAQLNNGRIVLRNGGTVSGGTASNGAGGNISSYAGIVRIETTGGTISGGQALGTGGSGGNIYMSHASNGTYLGTIDIQAGTVSGGYAQASGGNIYACNKTTATIAGTVVNKLDTLPEGATYHAKNGGNIFLTGEGTTMTVSGIVDGGYTSGLGGNICVDTKSELTVTDTGVVKNGVATTNGGNLYVCGGSTLTVNGTVSNPASALPTDVTRHAVSGGNIYVNGSTAGLTTVTIAGTVDGGISSSNGGSIFINNGAEVNIQNGAHIKNGKTLGTKSYGGNIYACNSNATGATVLNMTGGQITGGEAQLAGNVWVMNKDSQFNMSDGSISGGKSRTSDGQDNVRINTYAVMNMSGGTVYGTNGASARKGTAICLFVNGTLRLSGDAKVIRKDGVRQGLILATTSCGSVQVLNDWEGEATVYGTTASYGDALPEYEGAYVAGAANGRLFRAGSLDADGNFVKGGSYDGTLYYDMSGKPRVIGIEGTLYVASAQMVAQDGELTPSIDPVADFASGEYAYAKLYTTTLTLDGDLAVDINGQPLDVNGTGKLFVIDSANDTYDASKCGVVTVGDDVAVQPQVTVGDKRYVVITDPETGYVTSHRISIELANVALRMSDTLDNVGYYYQAVYTFDDAVKAMIDSYGVVVSKLNMPGVDFMSETKGENGWSMMTGELESGAPVNSGLLKNIMKAADEPSDNQAGGEEKVYANPYIVIKTGADTMTTLVADTENVGQEAGVAMSLKDVLVAIEAYWTNLDATVQGRMQSFYETWADKGMSAWATELPNISGTAE